MTPRDETEFCAALAASPQPDRAHEALCAMAQRLVGVKLFTTMTFDADTGMARRAWSNMPDAYPVSGTKPANETDWARQVLHRHQVFVANDLAGIRAVFFDHELIARLGCASVLNLPVVIGGRVIGTLNLLHEAGHFTPDRVAAAQALRLPGALCLMLAHRHALTSDEELT